MRKTVIAAAVLVVGLGAYWIIPPELPPLTGITSVELSGPSGRLREITQPDTVGRIVAFAVRHDPRWRSALVRSQGGPLTLTFYQGREPVRFMHFGRGTITSCAMDSCVSDRVSAAVVRELVDLVRVPRRLIAVPALDSAT